MERYISYFESEKDGIKKLTDSVNDLFKNIKADLQKKYEKSITENVQAFHNTFIKESKGRTMSDWVYSDNKIKNTAYADWDIFFSKEGDFKTNIKKIITVVALKRIEDLFDTYMTRMKAKMKNVVSNKSLNEVDLISARTAQGQVEAEFIFRFEQGQFTLRSQLVFVMNSFGTEFDRFPFTFHNAIFPDNKKVAKPSLAQIEQGFVKEDTDFIKLKNQGNIIQRMGFYPDERDIKDFPGLTMGEISGLKSRGMDKTTISKGTPFITYITNPLIKRYVSPDARNTEIEFKDGTHVKAFLYRQTKSGTILGIVKEILSLGDYTKPLELTGMAKDQKDSETQLKNNKETRKKIKSQMNKLMGIIDSDKVAVQDDKLGTIPVIVKRGFVVSIAEFTKYVESFIFSPKLSNETLKLYGSRGGVSSYSDYALKNGLPDDYFHGGAGSPEHRKGVENHKILMDKKIEEARQLVKRTVCTITYIDGTVLELRDIRWSDSTYFNKLVQKGKVKTNIDPEEAMRIRYFSGKVNEVKSLGKFTKELIVK